MKDAIKFFFGKLIGGAFLLIGLLAFMAISEAAFGIVQLRKGDPQVVWEGTEYERVYFAPDGNDGDIHMSFVVNDSVYAITWDGAIVKAFQEAGFQKREPVEGARIIVYDNKRMKVIVPEN